MRKRVMGFLAGALFISGIGFAASEFTANTGLQALGDRPGAMEGESVLPAQELAGTKGDQVGIDEGSIKLYAKPGKEQPGQRSSGSDGSQFKPLPLTRTVNDVEVMIHSIRVTEQNTDFEVTIKNNSDKEKVTLQLDKVMTEANSGVAGKAVEAVEAAADNPDFKDKTIRPTKELHGWVRHPGLKDRDIANLVFTLRLKGTKQTRTYDFLIDCTTLKFRTL